MYKQFENIEILIKENKLQETIQSMFILANDYTEKTNGWEDKEENMCDRLCGVFADKETLAGIIELYKYKVSKKSEIQNVNDLENDICYTWDYPTKRTIGISNVTDKMLYNVLDYMKNFVANRS